MVQCESYWRGAEHWTGLPDSQLQVPGYDPSLLVIPCGVPGKFENLCCQILHHSSHVDWSTSAHTLRIIALPVHILRQVEYNKKKRAQSPEQPVNTTHGKLKPGATRPRLGLAFYLPSFPAARHCSSDLEGVVTVANVQGEIKLVGTSEAT